MIETNGGVGVGHYRRPPASAATNGRAAVEAIGALERTLAKEILADGKRRANRPSESKRPLEKNGSDQHNQVEFIDSNRFDSAQAVALDSIEDISAIRIHNQSRQLIPRSKSKTRARPSKERRRDSESIKRIHFYMEIKVFAASRNIPRHTPSPLIDVSSDVERSVAVVIRSFYVVGAGGETVLRKRCVTRTRTHTHTKRRNQTNKPGVEGGQDFSDVTTARTHFSQTQPTPARAQ